MRLVDGIRKEVDIERNVHAQATCKLDGAGAAGLVKRVAVLGGGLRKHIICTLAVDTTDESFVRDDSAGLNIDDWLKSHGERENGFT